MSGLPEHDLRRGVLLSGDPTPISDVAPGVVLLDPRAVELLADLVAAVRARRATGRTHSAACVCPACEDEARALAALDAMGSPAIPTTRPTLDAPSVTAKYEEAARG